MRERQDSRAARLKELEEEELKAKEQDAARRKKYEERLAARQRNAEEEREQNGQKISGADGKDANKKRRRIQEEEKPRKQRDDEEDYGEEIKKAPLPIRLLAWAALICVFFALGYGGTSLFFKWLDSKSATKTVVSTPHEAAAVASNDVRSAPKKPNTIAYKIMIPSGSTFSTKEITLAGGAIAEDDIKTVLENYITELENSKILTSKMTLKNIFRSGEWLYVNMGAEFSAALSKMSAPLASSLLNGMAKTASENFAPINKVRIYIDGGAPKEKLPVDLSKPFGKL